MAEPEPLAAIDNIKKSLEVQKLNAEISELTKPWYRKAAYWGPAATLVAAFVVAFFAFFTNPSALAGIDPRLLIKSDPPSFKLSSD